MGVVTRLLSQNTVAVLCLCSLASLFYIFLSHHSCWPSLCSSITPHISHEFRLFLAVYFYTCSRLYYGSQVRQFNCCKYSLQSHKESNRFDHDEVESSLTQRSLCCVRLHAGRLEVWVISVNGQPH